MKMMIIDLEATCDENKDFLKEIIEIGFTVLDTSDCEFGVNGEISVKPKSAKITEFCTNLTGITEEENREKGIILESALNLFQSKLISNGIDVIGSWGAFDFFVLQRHIDMCDNPTLYNNIRNLPHLDLKRHVCDSFRWRKRKGVLRALEHFGLDFVGNHHRACDDAVNTKRIVVEALKQKSDLFESINNSKGLLTFEKDFLK